MRDYFGNSSGLESAFDDNGQHLKFKDDHVNQSASNTTQESTVHVVDDKSIKGKETAKSESTGSGSASSDWPEINSFGDDDVPVW